MVAVSFRFLQVVDLGCATWSYQQAGLETRTMSGVDRLLDPFLESDRGRLARIVSESCQSQQPSYNA
ncbi:unnamed protein product [Protopolystoma xenopodis]|uniref:Uncharacterized protein n=1 Tax=Protopolystoma xenopodis TaxID=117903 RepID=A0A448XR61_9PLAT|nr:unnamed protein product [Protopolystoma xenopodis]